MKFAIFSLILATMLGTAAVAGPLDNTSVVLLKHNVREDGVRYQEQLVVECAEEIKAVPARPLNQCQEYALLVRVVRKKDNLERSQTLGLFPASAFESLTDHILKNYKSKFDAGPLVIATGAGGVLGFFIGQTVGAVALGTIGLVLDILKAPVALPYTVASKVHRSMQKKKMEKRFKGLHRNKDFKAIKILGQIQFRDLLNFSLEWANTYR